MDLRLYGKVSFLNTLFLLALDYSLCFCNGSKGKSYRPNDLMNLPDCKFYKDERSSHSRDKGELCHVHSWEDHNQLIRQ